MSFSRCWNILRKRRSTLAHPYPDYEQRPLHIFRKPFAHDDGNVQFTKASLLQKYGEIEPAYLDEAVYFAFAEDKLREKNVSISPEVSMISTTAWME